MRRTGLLFLAAAVLTIGSGRIVPSTPFFISPALAQQEFSAPIPQAARQEPPARVGRVSVVAGTLAFFGPGDADWSTAQTNLPVAEGGWFATDPRSEAQLRIGSDAIALAPDSEINFASLREGFMQIAITRGRLYTHLRQRPQQSATNEIDLPRGGVWLSVPGVYDLDSGDPDQPTRITVLEGSARFVGGGIDRTITSGSRLVVSGSDSLTAETEPAGGDEFDNWCRAHEPREPKVAAPRVSAAMTGVEELSGYGSWTTVPRFGAVWFPRSVPADWVPYRTGRWVWIEPWGWNWVDDEPWGFAPFHYGRWARIERRWGWVPGRYVPEPVYAPALVAFIPPPAIEAAVPVDISDAGPPVGWFPLAPDEIYWPSYTQSPSYIRNLNITNVSAAKITNVTNVIVNQPGAAPVPQGAEQRFANQNAATVVPAKVVTTSAAVAAAAVAVPAAILLKARAARTPPPAVAAPVGANAAKPAPAPAAMQTPKAPAPAAAATPAHPPGKPEFSHLAPAPRVAQAMTTAKPAAATPAQSQTQMQPSHTAPEANHPVPSKPAQIPPSAPGAAPAAAAHAVPPAAQPPGAQPNRPAAGTAQTPSLPATVSRAAPPEAPIPGTPGPHAPPVPNFSRLAPPKPNGKGHATAPERHAPAAATAVPENPAPSKPTVSEPTAQATTPAPTPAHPLGPPNLSHLPSAHPTATETRQPAHPAAPTASAAHVPAMPARPVTGQHAPSAAEAMPHVPGATNTAPEQRAVQEQAKERAAAEAARQKAAQQAQKEKAASDAAARQRAAAEQQVRQQAAQQVQQRAAAEAAARQRVAAETQQRAAADAATHQRAAAEQQVRQQQAAQQARQHAAAEVAARQRAPAEAQQRAPAQAAAQQKAAQEAQKRAPAQTAAARPQTAHRPACGHPNEPPCPK